MAEWLTPTIKRRVGDLVVDDEFITCLTRRLGLVVDVQKDDSVVVAWDGGGEKALHPNVIVEVTE